jgi:hypothetical protein
MSLFASWNQAQQGEFGSQYTVPKTDITLRAIERMLQTQLSMARKFQL